MRWVFAVLMSAIALASAACSGNDQAATARAGPPSCPTAWKPGWQRLANRIHAAVYCPSWMPNPLDGEIGGQWDNGVSVDPDRSYLVSFLWHEAGQAGGDVHVNFRGYPGRTAIPKCEIGESADRRQAPCFSDAKPRRKLGQLAVTPFTVNQGADQWHVLYAWRRHGSLYTVSQHVALPLNYRKVARSLDRITRGLVLVVPRPVQNA